MESTDHFAWLPGRARVVKHGELLIVKSLNRWAGPVVTM
jgi:hypothetical protein